MGNFISIFPGSTEEKKNLKWCQEDIILPVEMLKVFYSVVFPCDAETFTDHTTKWKSHSSCTIPTKTQKEDDGVNYNKHWIGTIDTTEDRILKHPLCLGHLLKSCVDSFVPFVPQNI